MPAPPPDGDLVELNRRMIEAMPGGIVHVDADGAIVSANVEAQRILGLSLDAITKRFVRDWEPETFREDGSPCPSSEYPVAKALATGRPQPPVTIGVKRPDGNIAWAIFTAIPMVTGGAVSGAVVTFLDVTEQRADAQAMRRSEELLRSVLESAPNPIGTTDREGRLILLSKSPRPNAEELVGRPMWDGLVPEDRERVKAIFQRIIETGEPESYETVGEVTRRRWLVHAGPRREDGEIVGVTCVAWDVTKMKELESRLAIADRMASIGTLAAGVAHEINNPLTYLLANLHWVHRQAEELGDPKMRERLQQILEAAERIRSVVADLGSFSHTSEGRKVLLDVRPLLDAAVRMATNEIRCRARVVTRYDEVPPVFASDGRLGQVFLNLVVNAAQAIPEGDIEHNTITIATSEDEKGRVVVEVSDTGMGIAPEMRDKIFDPFVTTKPRGVGTGLGLYICKNVVTSLGGELSITSEPGHGTTFRVVLPGAEGTLRAAQELHVDTTPPTSGKRLRILVADDETSIATVMRSFLVDHDVEVVKTGREAIDRLSKADFDLAFCDLVMPDLTGMDVYEHLRKRRPGSEERLVFMTGGAFTERTRKFLETVPNEVLDKPFTLRDVAGVVSRRAG